MAGQKNEGEDTEIIYLIVIIAAFLLFKFFLKDYFLQAILYIKFGWVWLMHLVHPTNWNSMVLFYIETYQAKEWTPQQMDELLGGLQWIIGIPLALIIGVLAFRTFTKMPGPRYRRIMDGQSLTKNTLEQWPWLAPVLGKDLINKSLHKGEWAMAARPIEFSKRNRIYVEGAHKAESSGAFLVFANQLGSLWRGPEKLPKGIRVFLAAMLAHLNDDKKTSYQLLTDASMMFFGQDYGKTKAEKLAPWDKMMPQVNEVIKKYSKDKKFQRIVKKHAYESTVLTQLLEEARGQGVLPNSWFCGWMRPHYRRWYYMFEDVGRQTPVTESSGVHSHRINENVLGVAIEIPFVEKAAEALSAAIAETPVEYDDELPAAQRTDVDKGDWGY